MTTARELVQAFTPPWLAGYLGDAFMTAQGVIFDAVIQGCIDAVSARHFARYTLDGLRYVSQERGFPRSWAIDQSKVESLEQLRVRLIDSWRMLQKVGTPQGIVDAFAAYGLTAVVEEGVDSTRWNTFRITILDPPQGTVVEPWKWGDGTAWGEKTWGGLASWAGPLIRDLVRKWRPAHAICTEVRVMNHAKLWGPAPALTFNWGDGTSWGGTIVSVAVDQ